MAFFKKHPPLRSFTVSLVFFLPSPYVRNFPASALRPPFPSRLPMQISIFRPFFSFYWTSRINGLLLPSPTSWMASCFSRCFHFFYTVKSLSDCERETSLTPSPSFSPISTRKSVFGVLSLIVVTLLILFEAPSVAFFSLRRPTRLRSLPPCRRPPPES